MNEMNIFMARPGLWHVRDRPAAENWGLPACLFRRSKGIYSALIQRSGIA